MGIKSKLICKIPNPFGNANWICGQLRTITTVNLEYNYYPTQRGDAGQQQQKQLAIFMMHGLMGNKDNFRMHAQELAQKSVYPVYNLDMRNHGMSPDTTEHSNAHVAADMMELIHTQGLRQIIGIGHSNGGRGMMTLALTQPQIMHRLIIMDISPLTLPGNLMNLMNVFHLIVVTKIPNTLSLGEGRRQFKEKLDPLVNSKGASQLILKNLIKLPNGEFYWMVNAKAILDNWLDFTHYHNTIEGLPPYTGPTLLIASMNSGFVQEGDEEGISKYFPNLRVIWMNTGHLIHVEQPKAVIQHILDFCA